MEEGELPLQPAAFLGVPLLGKCPAVKFPESIASVSPENSRMSQCIYSFLYCTGLLGF